MRCRLFLSCSWMAVVPLVLSAAGCGGETLYAVEGTVRADGTPLGSGSVVLFPDDGRPLPGDRVPQGTIDEQGSYRITTAGRPGAPAGKYRVAVVAQTNVRPRSVPANPLNTYPLIAPQYFGPETSPLRIEVSPGPKPGAYDLAVTR